MANSNVNPVLASLSRSLHLIGKGARELDQGRAGTTVSLVMYAKELKAAADKDAFAKFLSHCIGLNADGKANPETVKAAWDYFSSLAHEHIGNKQDVQLHKLTSEKGTLGEDMASAERASENSVIGQRMRALREATSVIVRIDQVQADFADISCNRDMDALWVSHAHENQTMLRLFQGLKKDDSIRKNKDAAFTIATFGAFRFSMLASAGSEWLVAKGIKRKPNARTQSAPVLPRTVVKNAAELIDKADSKSLDSGNVPSSEDELLALALTVINELSAGDRKGFRISSKLAKKFLDEVEAERAAYDATFKKAAA